jgi:hypothetical protein
MSVLYDFSTSNLEPLTSILYPLSSGFQPDLLNLQVNNNLCDEFVHEDLLVFFHTQNTTYSFYGIIFESFV